MSNISISNEPNPEAEVHKSLLLDLQEADKFYFQSRYFDAHKAYEKILELAISQVTKTSEVSSLYHRLGLSAFKIGQFEDSRIFLSKALEMIEADENSDPLENARVVYAIGETLGRKAEFSEADQMYKKAETFIVETYGEEHRELIPVYNKWAYLCEQQEKYQEALEYLNLAFKISSQQNIENDAEVSTTYFRLARIHNHLNQNDKTHEYIHKSLLMRQEIYGQSHIEIATCYNILGYIEQDAKRLDSALEYYIKGQKMIMELVGENHVELANSYCKIGGIYFRQKKYELALTYYKKAVEIEKQVYPENHPNLAYTYRAFGNIYKAQGKYRRALFYYNKVLTTMTEKFGETHIKVSRCLGHLAGVYEKETQFKEARKLVKKQLAIQIKNLGPNDAILVDTYDHLGMLYYQDYKPKKALENFLMCHKINNSLEKKRLVKEAICYSHMGFAFVTVCDVVSEENMLKKCAKSFLQIKGRESRDTREVNGFLEATQIMKSLFDINDNL